MGGRTHRGDDGDRLAFLQRQFVVVDGGVGVGDGGKADRRAGEPGLGSSGHGRTRGAASPSTELGGPGERGAGKATDPPMGDRFGTAIEVVSI